MAYNLDDFCEDVIDMIRKTSRNSGVVRDIMDDIAAKSSLSDLADNVMADIYDDADKDDCLFDSRGRVNENVIQEAMGAVLGVVADRSFSNSEWSDLDDKVYDALSDGIEIYKDASERLDNNDYGRRDRGDRDRGRGGRSRGNRSRGSREERSSNRNGGRISERNRSVRTGRRTGVTTTSRDERREPTKPARPYNNPSARSERNRDRDEAPAVASRNDIAAALEDTGITTIAKLMSDMDVENVTIRDLLDYINNRAGYSNYVKNKEKIDKYLANANKPVIGGLGKDSLTGLVLQPDALLVDGEVKHVEHYMEHELSDKGRRANMKRYNMRVPKPTPVPPDLGSAVIEIDARNYNFINAGVFEARRALDIVDYTDLTVDAARALSGKGDYVVGRMQREMVALFTASDVEKVLPIVDGVPSAPKSFYQLHEMMTDAAGVELSDQAARFISQLEEAATHNINQCLHMADAQFVIESFHEDFIEAMEMIDGKDRFVKETFAKQIEGAFASMYNLTITQVDVEDQLYNVTLKRTVTVFYAANPIMANARLTDADYNTLHPSNFPELYRMLESIVEYRGDKAGDVVLVDALRNHYVINMRDVNVSAPIIIREI